MYIPVHLILRTGTCNTNGHGVLVLLEDISSYLYGMKPIPSAPYPLHSGDRHSV